jgi:hypothetical protein
VHARQSIHIEQRKLRPADQLPEVTIKTHQMFTKMDRRGSKPGIWYRIFSEFSVNAKLPERSMSMDLRHEGRSI